MNIVMMTNTYTPIVGGLEKSVQLFSKEFRKRGHRVYIVAPQFNQAPKYERGVIRIPALKEFQGTDYSVNIPIPGLLTKFIQRFKPDIVHSHHPFLVGDMALRLSRSLQIPLVFTYHIMFEQYVDHLPISNETFKHFVVHLAVGYSNLTAAVIVPTQSVKTILQSRGVTAPIHVIPTGIDVKAFSKGNGKDFRKEHNIPDKAFVIGYVGRISPEKNVEYLAKTIVQYLKTNSNAHFLLAGRGPLLKLIQEIFRSEDLENRLHYAGVLNQEQLIHCYQAMDVFAFSSLSETQGIVLIEALAAGTPVIAVEAPVVSEFVKDHKNGRLVENNNRKEFIKTLDWFYHLSPSSLGKLKRQAKKSVAEYSISNSVDSTLQLYVNLKESFDIKEKPNRVWQRIVSNLKIETELIKNFIEAGETAVKETFGRKKSRESL